MKRIGELWGSLRGILRNHPTFAQIKDLVGAAGLPVQELAHLQQKQSGGASKGQLMDEIDGLVNKLDNGQRDQFVATCTKELLRRYGHLRDEVEAAFRQHGWGINSAQEVVPLISGDSQVSGKLEVPSGTKSKKRVLFNPFRIFLTWYAGKNINPVITAAWVGAIITGFFIVWAAYIPSGEKISSSHLTQASTVGGDIVVRDKIIVEKEISNLPEVLKQQDNLWESEAFKKNDLDIRIKKINRPPSAKETTASYLVFELKKLPLKNSLTVSNEKTVIPSNVLEVSGNIVCLRYLGMLDGELDKETDFFNIKYLPDTNSIEKAYTIKGMTYSYQECDGNPGKCKVRFHFKHRENY